ncbi:hypothetical protein NM688_g7564 [Phlebia brevispora]|uniref:Uncharacterized protein n=1 Tax=Phlebia brevispora TaxID=194682 RepID=A0ACC1S3X1_9APHY|nr:hypothetical protein NM688_g7564 [Phlebia brevispora]
MPSRTVDSIIARIIEKYEPGATVSYANSSTRVRSSSGKEYFVKTGMPGEKEQFIAEAECLKAIHTAAPGLAPRLLECSVVSKEIADNERDVGKLVWVSEYKSMGSLTDGPARILAKRLAGELHAYKSTKGFGFSVPTFCGPTRQDNGWYDSWEKCYDALIAGLLAKLPSRYTELHSKGEEIRKRVIPALLGPLVIQPVLLHGDLWVEQSGNVGTDSKSGEPVIFDPSSYFGHNEADLALSRIFGGFPSSFLSTYHQIMPKSEPAEQYELRSDLYQLYHYLNHTVLFGHPYPQTKSCILTMPTASVIPDGYTFMNPFTMVSTNAANRFDELVEKMDNRNPDCFDMYIYNDYFNYGTLDIVDKELSTIHTKIIKKKWDEAYALLEGLTAFFDLSGCSWPMIDDGEQTELTDRVYGASLVTVLRALKKENRLSPEHFPSLETILKLATEWSKGMPQSLDYHTVLQGIGKRLFKDKSAETLALEKARVEEWIDGLPKEDRKRVREMIKEQKEEDKELYGKNKKKEWWDNDRAWEDDDDTDLTLSRVWKDYKAHLREYPNVPMRGPMVWDINDWTEVEKAPFLFSNMDV